MRTRTRTTWLRHGKSLKAPKDLDRVLCQEGEIQAQQRRIKLGSPKFDLAIASHASRAVATGELVSDQTEVLTLVELYTPSGKDGEELDALFAKLGYASLEEYKKAGGWPLLERYARIAIAAVKDASTKRNAKNVLVVGHAVLLNAIGFVLDRQGSQTLWAIPLGECEGFMDDGKKITLVRD